MTRIAKPDYGIDAPGLVRVFAVAGGGLLLPGLALADWGPRWMLALAMPVLAVSLYALGMGGLMVWGSRIDKVKGREAILDLVDWTGNEQVLDIGCGRGLMLVGAAQRLTAGHATGVDLWLDRDQSGNRADAGRRNAALEGVADRVTIDTADMRLLPFPDQRFDVILSHWAVHNLDDPMDRATAIAEMARVVKPGGTVVLTDIACRHEYLTTMRQLSFYDVRLVMRSTALDLFYGAVSFGTYRPATIVARAPMG